MRNNIALRVKRLNVLLEQYGRKQIKNLDISPSQCLLLNYLFSRKEGTVYATELHEQFGISKSAVSVLLKGMRQKGYLKIEVNPKDDRKKAIVLTPKAMGMQEQLNICLEKQQELLCKKISQEDMKIIERGLDIMTRNMRPATERNEVK